MLKSILSALDLANFNDNPQATFLLLMAIQVVFVIVAIIIVAVLIAKKKKNTPPPVKKVAAVEDEEPAPKPAPEEEEPAIIFNSTAEEEAPTISVVEEPAPESVVEPEPIEEPTPKPEPIEDKPVILPLVTEAPEGSVVRLNKGFMARLIQSDDELKQRYSEIKNALLSYKKVKARQSWKRETFKAGREVIAKLSYRGKTMCLFLALNPADYVDTKFAVEDASDKPSNAETPAMIRLRSSRRIKQATKLIEELAAKKNLVKTDRKAENFALPYEEDDALIEKGLIKIHVKSVKEEAIFTQGK